MRWYLANALGGVKVAVRPEDAERARVLFREGRSEEVVDQIDRLADEEPIRCPRCGAFEHATTRRRTQCGFRAFRSGRYGWGGPTCGASRTVDLRPIGRYAIRRMARRHSGLPSMTTSHEIGSLSRRLLAAGVFAALLAQIALPALHAVATEHRGVLAWRVLSARAPVFERATGSALAVHDPATCSICQSLMRTNPVARTWVSHGEFLPNGIPAFPAAPVCAHSTAAQSGHPPRAPPTHATALS